MTQFYQNIITETSFKLLVELNRQIKFILIGGWAIWLYTHSLKSKDIDIIVDYQNLAVLKSKFEIRKNDRLKKYEAAKDKVDVDIYLPYYSVLGIPVEQFTEHKSRRSGFVVIHKEDLLIMKLAAYQNRAASIKGQKDIIDIISLLNLPDFDFSQYLRILQEFGLLNQKRVIGDLLRNTREVPELSLNLHLFSKLKKGICDKLEES